MGNKAVGRARGCPEQNKNDDRFEQSPNRDTDFTQPDRHAVEKVNGRFPQFEYPQRYDNQADRLYSPGPESTLYVK